MQNPNLNLLLETAHRLRPLLDKVVFVGGCTTALLITDPGAEAIRPTYDVDVIVEITSYADSGIFSGRLRALGFQEDSSEGAPLCRWQWEQTKLDVMPRDDKVLGFSNRWYRETMTKAAPVRLDAGTVIRSITAPYFLATKLEAFQGRGKGDVFASHDLEDVIAVIDGRPAITEEIQAADESSGIHSKEDSGAPCGQKIHRRPSGIPTARCSESRQMRPTPICAESTLTFRAARYRFG
jgi:hypothetical protein